MIYTGQLTVPELVGIMKTFSGHPALHGRREPRSFARKCILAGVCAIGERFPNVHSQVLKIRVSTRL